MPPTSHQEILNGLVHDLRQPLGNLESSLFYLDLVLQHPAGKVGEQLQMMERQVAQAANVLHRAAEELRKMQAQCAGADSLPRTKSATAGVT